jgi:hypothetical protein
MRPKRVRVEIKVDGLEYVRRNIRAKKRRVKVNNKPLHGDIDKGKDRKEFETVSPKLPVCRPVCLHICSLHATYGPLAWSPSQARPEVMHKASWSKPTGVARDV